jgi:hypothetical protein
MSDQPYGFGFGQQLYGQIPQQSNSYPSTVTPQNSSFPGPPRSASIDQDYAASMGAFEFNSSQIPGLGGVAPAPPAPPPQLARANSYNAPSTMLGSWAQHPPFAPSSAAVDQASLFNPAPFVETNQLPPGSAQVRKVSNPSKAPKLVAVTPPKAPASIPNPKPKPQAGNDMEEGELSEGQFEDLYESSQPDVAGDATNPPTSTAAHEETASGELADDVGDEGFYDNEEEGQTTEGPKSGFENGTRLLLFDVGALSTRLTARTGRERSASYSPISPPRETNSDAGPSKGAQVATNRKSSRPPVSESSGRTIPNQSTVQARLM